MEKDIIHKSGAFFSYNDLRLAQGRDNARQYLKEHPELTAEIDAKVREIIFSQKDAGEQPKERPAGEKEEEDDLALLDEDI